MSVFSCVCGALTMLHNGVVDTHFHKQLQGHMCPASGLRVGARRPDAPA